VHILVKAGREHFCKWKKVGETNNLGVLYFFALSVQQCKSGAG
jgi:hypothetical protein